VAQRELLPLEEEGDGGVQLVLGDGEALEADGRDKTLLEVLLHVRDGNSVKKRNKNENTPLRMYFVNCFKFARNFKEIFYEFVHQTTAFGF
jgi:hypothetical protein